MPIPATFKYNRLGIGVSGGLVGSEKPEKTQISPLRCAPVEMTILFEGVVGLLFEGVVGLSTGDTAASLQQNCHLDRSVAEWRDLRFLPGPHKNRHLN
jgi:hypothetical protein